jgi:hypothetical protein
MVLDHRGFAMMWEILSSDASLRVFFVSKTVERAAERVYGRPLPDRRYCVEPSLEQHPDIVVARIVGDGPQPMGPILYLEHSNHHVTNVICRCEPSQADLFPRTREYQLITLETKKEPTGASLHAAVSRLCPQALARPSPPPLRCMW